MYHSKGCKGLAYVVRDYLTRRLIDKAALWAEVLIVDNSAHKPIVIVAITVSTSPIADAALRSRSTTNTGLIANISASSVLLLTSGWSGRTSG
jgi:hypothetical protein